ncbi:unnamed protein product [Orchesella dallaii]|uniref:Uncharacterized protein n=1 Tax=Orchesella dallaii TaxID=48710 RepID=A0ABP1PI45_9HEXA
MFTAVMSAERSFKKGALVPDLVEELGLLIGLPPPLTRLGEISLKAVASVNLNMTQNEEQRGLVDAAKILVKEADDVNHVQDVAVEAVEETGVGVGNWLSTFWHNIKDTFHKFV